MASGVILCRVVVVLTRRAGGKSALYSSYYISMKSHPTPPGPQEIELKLALPTLDPASLVKRLARAPVLARRTPTQQHLHNIYYDTPDQQLHQARVALRLRRVGSEAHPQWLQTLKTGGRSDSALSQRGEWESPVPGSALSWHVLKATPWADTDADGALFKKLKPCFITQFERTSWQVRRRNGSVVEVALDIGYIDVEGKQTPICELELELKAGLPAALFEVARQIAQTIAVLPATMSKAERGYALAQDSLDQPWRAQPLILTPKLPLPQLAQQVLRESFCQFTRNLNALRHSDDPEVVHQARVGWRRFKSALRFFKPVLALDAVAPWQALHALLVFLGELRDLDVVRTQTLPPLADAYTAGDDRRAQNWHTLFQALNDTTDLQRKAVRYALQEPAIGVSLLATTQWLEDLTSAKASVKAKPVKKVSVRRWTRQRVLRWQAQLERALKALNKQGRTDASNAADYAAQQHRVRLLAKRVRYAVESLQPLLSGRQIQRGHPLAERLQTTLGNQRDVVQACVLATRLSADRGLIEFLRGAAASANLKP